MKEAHAENSCSIVLIHPFSKNILSTYINAMFDLPLMVMIIIKFV